MAPTETLQALVEPSRRRILDELRGGELPVSALVERTSMQQPTVSKHLRLLRQAGLVKVRPDGQRRVYRVDVAPLQELDDWLEPYRAMWRVSLDRLEARLDTPFRSEGDEDD